METLLFLALRIALPPLLGIPVGVVEARPNDSEGSLIGIILGMFF